MMKSLLVFVFFINVFLHTKCDILSNFQLKSGNTTISGNTTHAPFGAITGYASTNVPAYSNGNDSYISDDYNFLYGVYTGMKWQCVEYARRWLFVRKGCVFDSVDGAADMWNLTTVQRVLDKQCFNLKLHPNGSSDLPSNESLLIYKRSGTDMPFGHVAVIVDVLPGFIRVAEENYYPYYWSGNYSRQIQYVMENGSYYILDDYPIFGWITVEDNNQTKPLDQLTIDAIVSLNGTSPDFICPNNTSSSAYPNNTSSSAYPNNTSSSVYPNNTTSSIYSNNASYHYFSIGHYLVFVFLYILFFIN